MLQEQFGMEDRVREFDVSSATVELAALALGVEGARIAKTPASLFKKDDSCILILAAGNATGSTTTSSRINST